MDNKYKGANGKCTYKFQGKDDDIRTFLFTEYAVHKYYPEGFEYHFTYFAEGKNEVNYQVALSKDQIISIENF